MSSKVICAVLLCGCGVVPSDAAVSMPTWFQDNMVLQSNRESGYLSYLNGMADPNEKVVIETANSTYTVTADEKGEWAVTLNPEGMNKPPSTITVKGESGPPAVANDMLYGDVFFCSGGADMLYPLKLAFNSTQEASSLTGVDFANFRFFMTPQAYSDTPLFDFKKGGNCPDPKGRCLQWLTVAQAYPSFIQEFSAVCYLTSRDITQIHNLNPSVPSKPVGIILSASSSSRIESWMPSGAFSDCPQYPPVPAVGPSMQPSAAYNAMIHPFRHITLRAALWYQGALNAEQELPYSKTDSYACYLKAMIGAWRVSKGTGDFPFITMQLPPSAPAGSDASTGTPDVRAAQLETLPHVNGSIAITGLAVGIDLGGNSTLGYNEPPNKNEAARRMAMQAVHVAYGVQGRMNNMNGGPVPYAWDSYFTGPVFLKSELLGSNVKLTFDANSAVAMSLVDVQSLNSNGSVTNCTMCCEKEAPFEVFANGAWMRVAKGSTLITNNTVTLLQAPASTAVRYAWSNFVGCKLANSDGLPASPFLDNLTAEIPLKPLVAKPKRQRAEKPLLPPLGWNSWNYYHCNIDEVVIKDVIDAMVDSGLHAAGYEYVNIDDCWQASRDASGTIVPDPARFPSGLRYLADYAHSKGMKFGVYTARSEYTCQMRPGGYGYETLDAQTYCDWGIDYLKIDVCWGKKAKEANATWELFHEGFQKCYADGGQYIVQSVDMSAESEPTFAEWIRNVTDIWTNGGGDIQANWQQIIFKALHNNQYATVARPGHYNNADMLEVGNYGVSVVEAKSQMSLWAVMTSPIMVGTDLLHASAVTMEILSNSEVLAVNQDLGRGEAVQGTLVSSQVTPSNDTLLIWTKPLSTNDTAVLLLNNANTTQSITVSWSTLGIPPSRAVQMRDLWSHSDIPAATGSYTAHSLQAHESAFLLFKDV